MVRPFLFATGRVTFRGPTFFFATGRVTFRGLTFLFATGRVTFRGPTFSLPQRRCHALIAPLPPYTTGGSYVDRCGERDPKGSPRGRHCWSGDSNEQQKAGSEPFIALSPLPSVTSAVACSAEVVRVTVVLRVLVVLVLWRII